MSLQSVPTRGRTLDYAAGVYDIFEPMCLLGKQSKINNQLIELLEINDSHKILDIGCGTGFVTKKIADKLSAETGGLAIGIDAAGKMIEGARKKRGSNTCHFEVAAAENLLFENESFDSVISTLFFHHIQLDLKKKGSFGSFSCAQARRTVSHLRYAHSHHILGRTYLACLPMDSIPASDRRKYQGSLA